MHVWSGHCVSLLKMTSHAASSYEISCDWFYWRQRDKLDIWFSLYERPYAYTKSPDLGTSSSRACTDARPCWAQRSLQQCPASPPPTQILQINKKEINISNCFFLEQTMLSYHVSLHMVNATKQNVTDRTARLPFMHVIMLVKRPNICKRFSAHFAPMSFLMLITALPFQRITNK